VLGSAWVERHKASACVRVTCHEGHANIQICIPEVRMLLRVALNIGTEPALALTACFCACDVM
jgi:hypothetical protein